MIKFFTLPPSTIPYPFILINANNPEPGLRYIKRHRKHIKEVIIDSGVEIFRDPSVKDYPPNHMHKIYMLWREVKRYVSNVWAVVPDYPDDYNPKSLWVNDFYTNIERTVHNVYKADDLYEDVNWIIPIQGHYKKPESILRAIELYEWSGILQKYRYFAIANLCVENDVDIIRETLRLARRHLRHKLIHAFGINLRAIRFVFRYIDSFDSMAWTRPVSLRLGRWSAKNLRERELYFKAWLNRLHQIISNADLFTF